MAGIYIHIPFCKTKCPYCDFYSIQRESGFKDYIQALLREIDLRSDYIKEPVSTIYFGGGTPSLLKPGFIDEILLKIDQAFNINPSPEITFECNPDDLSLLYTKQLYNAGINRISLGTQSFIDSELEILGRRHSMKKNFEALEAVLSTGFDDVSIDLIYGLPGSSVQRLNESINQVMRFPVNHISAYHLTIEEGTLFHHYWQQGKFKELPEDMSGELFQTVVKKLEANNFEQYEISNFARDGYYSRHNSNYWKDVPYIGLGPAAHSFNGSSREWNVADVKKYISSLNMGEIPAEKEFLSINDLYNEFIMKRLRTSVGLNKEEFIQRFGEEKFSHFLNTVQKYIGADDLTESEGNFFLTESGKFLSDHIIRDLILIE
jgi:oxygen-independent coproporphyrinogen-3 oxidase